MSFLALKFGMDSRKRGMKSLRHFHESYCQSRPAPNQHIIMTLTHGAPGGRKPHGLTKTAANPVAFDSAADLARHSEADAYRALISPIAPLDDKCPVCGSRTASRRPKITAAP
jgi:hypothetical protein